MYLKRLEMQGFKSFADKTVLELRKGITTVIGPNGSGKSNLSDAIRWVLGEQSMKSLRGTKSLDVIFAGTQNRKSLGFAEASLVFDNSDGALPIEYQEVTVTRKLYRSGETGYFINKTPCRLKDVLELFMDTGIGRDGYSIIGQGKIDEILSNKSEDRRHIFEEAAGIVKYRIRKQESEKKLEHTKLNLLRINDILTEIEGNLEPLKEQSEKAKKYLNLRDELKNIEIGLFIHNIEKYKQTLQELTKDEGITKEQCNEEEGKLERIKMLKEELKSAIDDITAKIEEMSNLGFESQKEIEMLNSDINVAKTRISNNKENKLRFEKEIEENQKRMQELEEEKKQKEDKKFSLRENKEKFTKELEEKQKSLEEITKTLSAKALEIENNKRTVEENTDKKYELQSEINTQKINYENYEKRQKQIEGEIQTNISELDTTRMRKEDISKDFYEIENKRNKKTKEIEQIKKQKEEANQKIKNYEIKINNLASEIRIKESRQKFLIETEKEKEGYIKSVKALLKDCENTKELGKGMYGVLANIIEVPEELQTAIEMCLGASLQNIVTETEEDAKRLVEHLRKNNLGRASFLPITSVRGSKLEKIRKNEKGYIGIASDLIKYNKKYEQIIYNLLGRTVIVDNMDTAIKIAKQNKYAFRIVTKEGDVINASGAITGGSVTKKTVNILGRSKEIEKLGKEIEEGKKKIQDLTKEKEEYEESIEGILELSANLEKDLQEIDITYATEKQKILLIEENIQKIEKRIKTLKEEKISIIVAIYNIEKYLENCIKSILQQTYKNLEILLIDDGSTDSSKEICDKYAQIDNRIKVIHKENGGLADARNLGMSLAKGKYISFIDGDDYIYPTFYTNLYDLIEQYEADISECNFLRVNEDDIENIEKIINKENQKIIIKEKMINGEEAIDELFGTRLQPYVKKVVVWNKLYNANVLRNIKFPFGKLHEDEYTTYKILSNSKKIVTTNKILHGYVQTKNSIMRREIKQKRIDDNLDAYEQASNFFEEKNDIKIEMKCKRRYLENCIELSGKVLKSENKNKDEQLKDIEDKFISYYEKYIDNIILNSSENREKKIVKIIMLAYKDIKTKGKNIGEYWQKLENFVNK